MPVCSVLAAGAEEDALAAPRSGVNIAPPPPPLLRAGTLEKDDAPRGVSGTDADDDNELADEREQTAEAEEKLEEEPERGAATVNVLRELITTLPKLSQPETNHEWVPFDRAMEGVTDVSLVLYTITEEPSM